MRKALILAVVCLIGCGDDDDVIRMCTSNADCMDDQMCVNQTCVAGDAGPADAGDAGTDAGDDSGFDAGPPPDRDMDGLPDDDEPTYGADPDNPDTDNDGLNDGDEVAMGSDPTVWDTDEDGVPDGDEVFLGTDPTVPDEACAGTSGEASIVRRPVDIIIVIDSSGSMNGEIEAVERNINENLAVILAEEDVDYRVIMIAEYRTRGGDARDGVCISAPLSGIDDCTNPPSEPINGERFFHYPQRVGSHNSMDRILETYAEASTGAPDGWRAWLRPEALRAFMEISDDDASMRPDAFEAALFALENAAGETTDFGTAEERNYVWHSIIGMAANDPADAPWPPEAPVQLERCTPGSAGYAEDYQELSIRTGGLRFPLCNNDSFDVIFRHVAQDVVTGVALACTYAPVPPMDGETANFDRVVVVYEPGPDAGEDPRSLRRVADESACAEGDYYVADEVIQLCPTTCDALEGDEAGALGVHVACEQLCGNGVLNGDEQCDDGNREAGDGCSPTCEEELM